MTIEFDVLFTDLFCDELKPLSYPHGSCFKSSGKGKSSLEIFLDQANSMSGLTGLHAAQAAWRVADDMEGIQGKARTPAAQRVLCNAVISAVTTSVPKDPKRFIVAVNQVAAVTHASKFGRQRSAASKMLQVFDEFLDVAVIYDSVVKRALGPDDVGKYVDEFDYQFNQLHIKHNGSLITMKAFFNEPSVKAKITAAKIPVKLNNFIERRSFDRVLWLTQKAKDQSGSRVLGLCSLITSPSVTKKKSLRQ